MGRIPGAFSYFYPIRRPDSIKPTNLTKKVDDFDFSVRKKTADYHGYVGR